MTTPSGSSSGPTTGRQLTRCSRITVRIRPIFVDGVTFMNLADHQIVDFDVHARGSAGGPLVYRFRQGMESAHSYGIEAPDEHVDARPGDPATSTGGSRGP